ncbi:hypothetical protein M378DRAFT_161818 [Amanita muscaria Koide BX008]|uniref:Uncharacterized protein n=1 Tax=Amanita muscaria (strain Koide BX008) TaxID=946122 RepID=A0A0C2TFZ8_AMAMK|nr:hypothetical protein M378DRAFT_161818 [Amanita muscaria Koide BX008]
MEAQHLAYPVKEAAQSGNTHASSTKSGGSGFTTNGSESTTAGGDMARIVVNTPHTSGHLDSSSSEPHRVRDRESGSPMPPFHDESGTDSMSGPSLELSATNEQIFGYSQAKPRRSAERTRWKSLRVR